MGSPCEWGPPAEWGCPLRTWPRPVPAGLQTGQPRPPVSGSSQAAPQPMRDAPSQHRPAQRPGPLLPSRREGWSPLSGAALGWAGPSSSTGQSWEQVRGEGGGWTGADMAQGHAQGGGVTMSIMMSWVTLPGRGEGLPALGRDGGWGGRVPAGLWGGVSLPVHGCVWSPIRTPSLEWGARPQGGSPGLQSPGSPGRLRQTLLIFAGLALLVPTGVTGEVGGGSAGCPRPWLQQPWLQRPWLQWPWLWAVGMGTVRWGLHRENTIRNPFRDRAARGLGPRGWPGVRPSL